MSCILQNDGYKIVNRTLTFYGVRLEDPILFNTTTKIKVIFTFNGNSKYYFVGWVVIVEIVIMGSIFKFRQFS